MRREAEASPASARRASAAGSHRGGASDSTGKPKNRFGYVLAALAVAAAVAITATIRNPPRDAGATPAAPDVVTAEMRILKLGPADGDLAAGAEARRLLASGSAADAPASRLATGTLKTTDTIPLEQVVARMPEAQRQEVMAGNATFHRFLIYDFWDQDGDVVEIAVNGTTLGIVAMSNRGTHLTLPLRPGETARVSIRAVRDGGGGVTLGARSSVGEARTRIMAVGESDEWTVVAP